MGRPDGSRPQCRWTGLTLPECSCPSCLEEMLRRFQPELLEPPGAPEALGLAREGELGEIRITRTAGTEAARPPFADPA